MAPIIVRWNLRATPQRLTEGSAQYSRTWFVLHRFVDRHGGRAILQAAQVVWSAAIMPKVRLSRSGDTPLSAALRSMTPGSDAAKVVLLGEVLALGRPAVTSNVR